MIAAVWSVWLWNSRLETARRIAVLVAANLAINLIFFMSHPIFTPYYIIPIDMLSLWTLLFATLDVRGQQAADRATVPRTAEA